MQDIQLLPAESLEWESRLQNDIDNPIWDMIVDENGNVYVVGRTDGSLEGEPHAGDFDNWIAKYNTEGELLWVEQYGSQGDDRIWGISLFDDYIYVAGRTNGSLGDEYSGSMDIFLSQYDSDGNLIWTEQYGTRGLDATNSVEVDGQGNPIVIGFSNGISTPNYDVVVNKFDSAGNAIWETSFGSFSSDDGQGVTRVITNGGYIDGGNNIYATGDLVGRNADSQRVDVFVSKQDPNGSLLWIQELDSSAEERAFDIEVDSQGNVYIVGWTLGSLEGTSAGEEDAFIAKYDAEGNLEWIDQFGSPVRDFGYGLAIENDSIYVTGYSQFISDNEQFQVAVSWVANYDETGVSQWQYYIETDYNDFSRGIDIDSEGNIYLSGYTDGLKGENPAGEKLTNTTLDKDKDSWVLKIDATSLPSPDSSPASNFGSNDLLTGSSNYDSTILVEELTTTPSGVVVDGLTGGAGGDLFALGDTGGSFYSVDELHNIAIIRDFIPDRDLIQLSGEESNYHQRNISLGTAIFSDTDMSGGLSSEDSLVAVIAGRYGLDLSNSGQFVYV